MGLAHHAVSMQRCGQLPRTERECKFAETSSRCDRPSTLIRHILLRSAYLTMTLTCPARTAYPARVAGIAVEEFKQE
eukprot:49763-Eustigmatos_ZCMA.PRE.1